jgi:acyl-CoA reductase-like NAD-dependent aldehyde dehydrogenase
MLELEQLDVAAWWALALEKVGLEPGQVEAPSIITGAAIVLLSLLFLPGIYTRFRERPRRVSVAPLPQALADWTPQKPLSQVTIEKAARDNIIIAYCPATGSPLDEITADTKDSINKKLSKALTAQVAWKDASWTRRRKVLKTIRAWIVKDIDIIARTACRDTGKTAIDAVLGEILTTLAKLNWLISDGEKVLRKEVRSNNILLAHKRCTVYHEPFGVVAALVSWNYPCHNALSPAVAALTSGNAIVIKCSEIVAWSSSYFIAGLHACLAACNESPDLVQLVCCFPPVAPILTSHRNIKHITFIGSEVVAKHVARDAAKSLTPCCLELGGKDPMVILEDTNIKFFVQTWLRAAFGAAGQNCIGAERFIVSSKIMDAFLEAVEPKVRTLRQGSFLDDGEVDVGAMISDNRFDTIESLIKDAVYHGARLVAGGRRYHHPKYPSGHYFQPTLIVDVTPDMAIAKEELFAPVFLVMSFNTVEDAIRLANSTRYGLGSSVFGSNRRTCRYIADRLECGMVNINDFAVSYLNQGLPFGGIKASGNGGRFGGPEGLLSLTTTKAVTEDRFFSLIKTAIPGPVHYPHKDPRKSQAFVVGLASFFGGSWKQATGGIAKLIKASM